MTWMSALIFILGLAAGFVLARLTQTDLRKQKKMQSELEKISMNWSSTVRS